MSESKVNANISEVEGPFYPVRLAWVPRVGELIDFYTLVDSVRGLRVRYEVVQIVHQLHALTDEVSAGSEGHHFVTVLVKAASENPLFEQL